MQDQRKKGNGKPPILSKVKEFPSSSWRLTFNYNKEKIEFVNALKIKMIAPPTDKLGKLEPCSGFCIELRTQRNRVLYRRFDANPIPTNVEVPSGNPEQPFARVDIKDPQGEFDILIPAWDNAKKIVLLSDSHLEKSSNIAPVYEHNLDDLPTKNKYK